MKPVVWRRGRRGGRVRVRLMLPSDSSCSTGNCCVIEVNSKLAGEKGLFGSNPRQEVLFHNAPNICAHLLFNNFVNE